MTPEAAATPLRNATLPHLRGSGVRLPEYDRTTLREGIVHLGVGGFHRAHMALVIDRLLAAGGAREWAIRGAGLLPADAAMRDALVPQDGLYTLLERDAAGEHAAIVGSLRSYVFAPADPLALVADLAAPATRIVSLTITEGGYLRDEATGALDLAHADVAADLRGGTPPRSTYGFLAAALALRRAAGLAPFTVLSCDNVQSNGDMVRALLLQFLAQRDPPLGDWIAQHGAFPNAMVDRITPRTQPADRAHVARAYGIDDAWPVVAEPFLQWVLEDRFADGRPEWERAGVQMVGDVAPYERMKLRVLNAGHSALGYLGVLAGLRTVDAAVREADFSSALRRMLTREVKPLLPPLPGLDADAYIDAVMARFANPAIADSLARICQDGSGKMPKFILPSIRDALARGLPCPLLTLCVAAWVRYLRGVDDAGRAYAVEDQFSAALRERAIAGGDDPRPVLAFTRVFGEDLPAARPFVDAVGAALESLHRHGARATLQAALAR